MKHGALSKVTIVRYFNFFRTKNVNTENERGVEGKSKELVASFKLVFICDMRIPSKYANGVLVGQDTGTRWIQK